MALNDPIMSLQKVENPDTTHIEVKMLKNGYPFGGVINKHMMNDDYQRENWPVLFNYGVGAATTIGNIFKNNRELCERLPKSLIYDFGNALQHKTRGYLPHQFSKNNILSGLKVSA